MAKVADVVNQGIRELQDDLKAAKQAGEEDLGKAGQVFFDISEKADKIGERLLKADEALNHTDEEDGDDEGNGDGEEGQEGNQ